VSVVVGMVTRTGVYMAADTQVTDDSGHTFYEAEKIFQGKDYLIGVAGDYKIVSLMSGFEFSWKKDKNKFLVTELPLLIKDYLSAYVTDSSDSEARDQYSIIVAHSKGMCEINENNEAHLIPVFHAIGTGAPYAFGAYYGATENVEFGPKDILEVAVKAAIRYNAYCGGDINMNYLPD
jgi:ATP-dependent protease HslVU (ClpYQ) peptidase subunit